MTIAPASAPASGRANSRARRDLRPTRSSWVGGGVTSACNVSLMDSSQLRAIGGPPARRPPARRPLPGASRGVDRHLGDVAAVDERRAGQPRLATAEDVAVD